MKTKSSFFLITLILLITTTTACNGEKQNANPLGSPTSQQSGPAKASSSTGTYFSVNEIGLGPNGFIALTNFTDVPASLVGLYLCQETDCFELSDVVVDPNETVRVSVGNGAGTENVIATRASLGELRPSDGEVALFASNRFNDPHEMLVYFQWGSDPHKLTQTAIEAGLWVKGGYGPSSENATRLYRVEESGLWLFED